MFFIDLKDCYDRQAFLFASVLLKGFLLYRYYQIRFCTLFAPTSHGRAIMSDVPKSLKLHDRLSTPAGKLQVATFSTSRSLLDGKKSSSRYQRKPLHLHKDLFVSVALAGFAVDVLSFTSVIWIASIASNASKVSYSASVVRSTRQEPNLASEPSLLAQRRPFG